MMFKWLLAAFAALISPVAADHVLEDRARAALQPLKSELQSELKAGMASGPISAMEVCRSRAPEIAARLQSESLQLGRTSHKLRNRENAPRPWVAPILAGYLANPEDARPVVVRLPEGRVGYVEPIVTQPLCVVCHGERIAEPLRKKIEELYPEDGATEFKAGDLRGVFWVEMNGE
jgi:hypothetical protein